MTRARLAAALVVAAFAGAWLLTHAACDEPIALRLSAPELATPPPRATSHAARAPSTAACTGRSDDPPRAVLEAAVEQANTGSSAAYAELLALAFAWPRSATVRVRAADAARDPGDAARLIAEAVRLNDTGCALARDDLHAALHELGAARLTEGDLPGARAAFARAVATDPSAAPTHYAYAATLCRSHEREACVLELLAALDAGDAGTSLRELAARDPDFEAVRGDARVSARVVR